MFQSLAIYCGSSAGKDPIYRDTAYALGGYLAEHGITLVYGGGSVGLMGAVADGALAKNGKVIGVIPRLLNRRELAHPGVSAMHVVESMHERKQLMADLSQGFVALPGGFGTLDELCEVLTWSQLGIHSHPVGLLDLAGYFTPFLHCLDGMVSRGFLRQADRDRLLTDVSFPELLEKMQHWKAPEKLKWE
jgi:uncharacterized protein (TIGR00730 family)